MVTSLHKLQDPKNSTPIHIPWLQCLVYNIHDLCIFCNLQQLYSHEHYTYTYICMQKHNDAMKTSGYRSLAKYNSHFIIFYCVWEWVGDWTELQHMAIRVGVNNSVSFPFSWAAQPGAWGPSLSGTWSSFQHLLSNSNCSVEGPESPLHWVLVLSTASYFQLTWTSCRRGYIIIWRPLFFLRASQFRTRFIHSTVKFMSWYSSTGCTCYLHRCIFYFDSSAGVNIQHNVKLHLAF